MRPDLQKKELYNLSEIPIIIPHNIFDLPLS